MIFLRVSMFMLIGIGIDKLTERLRQEHKDLLESEEKYRSLVESSKDSIYLMDTASRYCFLNSNNLFRRGLSMEQIKGKLYADFHSLKDTQNFIEKLDYVVEQGESISYEYFSTRVKKYFLRTLSPVRGLDGKVAFITVVSKDINELKQAQKELKIMVDYDGLTNIYNRRYFEEKLTIEITRSIRYGTPVSLLMLDIDNFKEVNDKFGHVIGDRLLQGVAERFSKLLRKTDTICRLGGDEFIILLPRLTQPRENAVDVSQKILNSLNEPFLIKVKKICITTSIGIALYPDNGEEEEVLIKSADKAMYLAKKEGPNNYHWAEFKLI